MLQREPHPETRAVRIIDGDVVRVDRREGETVDEQTSVITVVRVEPLRIDVSVPVPVSQKLEDRSGSERGWLDIETEQPTIGKVIFISRAGEASVREVLVRIEVPNADGLPSGMHARVAFEGEMRHRDRLVGPGGLGVGFRPGAHPTGRRETPDGHERRPRPHIFQTKGDTQMADEQQQQQVQPVSTSRR